MRALGAPDGTLMAVPTVLALAFDEHRHEAEKLVAAAPTDETGTLQMAERTSVRAKSRPT